MPDTRRVHVAVPPDMYERLVAAATQHERSAAAELRVALKLYLDGLERAAARRAGAAA